MSGVADAVLMDFPGDLVRGVLDPIRYAPTYLAVLVTLGVAIMRRPAVPDDGRSIGSRPAKAATMAAMAPWDSTWYLGVHVWGIDTVGHHWNFLTGGLCFGPTGMYYALESWLVSLFVLVFVLVAGVTAECIARRRGLRARRTGALPLPVVGAILSVFTVWVVVLVAFIPVR